MCKHPGHKCRSRRADTKELKFQNRGGIRRKVQKNSYTGPKFLQAHHVTDEPDAGKTSAGGQSGERNEEAGIQLGILGGGR